MDFLLISSLNSQKGRTPAYYKKSKNSEDIDRGLLTVIPDAPRVAEQGFPPHFSWDSLPAKFYQPPLKFSQSEINLSSNTEGYMKQSNSAFEILSTTDGNMNNEEVQEEEIQKLEQIDSERPKTFKLVLFFKIKFRFCLTNLFTSTAKKTSIIIQQNRIEQTR